MIAPVICSSLNIFTHLENSIFIFRIMDFLS